MPYKVILIGGAAGLDSAPVAQVASYPLEERDYKPYAQCNLCLAPEALLLRMWAFEVSPPAGSFLRAVLYLFECRPDTALAITFTPEGGCALSLWKAGAEEQLLPPPEGLKLFPHSGEDLQGVYWGATARLPLDWLAGLGAAGWEGGRVLPGNFYKICPGPQMAHWGSWHPANFPEAPYDRGSMGELLVAR